MSSLNGIWQWLFDSDVWKTIVDFVITVLEWLHLERIARLIRRKRTSKRKLLSVQEALRKTATVFTAHSHELNLDITAYARTRNPLHLDGKSVFGPKICARREIWDTLGITKEEVRVVLSKTFCRARTRVDAAHTRRKIMIDTIACAAAIDFLTLLAAVLRERWQQRKDIPVNCLEALQLPSRIEDAIEKHPELEADIRGYCAHTRAGKHDPEACRAVHGILLHLRDIALPRSTTKDIEESVVADTRQFIKARLLQGDRGRRSKGLAELACLHMQVTLLIKLQEYVLA